MYILPCNVTIAVGHLTNLLSDTPDEWQTDNGREGGVSPFPLVIFLLMCVSALVRMKSKQVLLCDMSENQKRLERYMEVLSNGCRCAEKPESRGWWDIVSLCPGIVQIHFRELKLPTHTTCTQHLCMAVNMVCQMRMRNCLWRFIGIGNSLSTLSLDSHAKLNCRV